MEFTITKKKRLLLVLIPLIALFFIPSHLINLFLNSLANDGSCAFCTPLFFVSFKLIVLLSALAIVIDLRQFSSKKSKFRKDKRILVLVLTLVGFLLRSYTISSRSLWLDEAVTYSVIQGGTISSVIQNCATSQSWPPFFYILNLISVPLFGKTELALRFLPLIFGTLTIPLIYIVGKKLFNEKTGFIAAILFALNPYSIIASQNARPYSLLILLCVASTYFLLNVIKDKSKPSIFAYILLSTLALYTHVFALFFIASQALIWGYHLIKTKKNVSDFALAYLIILFLYLPWLKVLYSQIQTASLHDYIINSSLFKLIYVFLEPAVGILFILLVIKAFLSIKETKTKIKIKSMMPKDNVMIALSLSLLPIFFLLILSLFNYDFLQDRYLSFCLPFMILFIANALTNFRPKMMKIALLLIAVIYIITVSDYHVSPSSEEFKQAFEFADNNYPDSNPVFIYSGEAIDAFPTGPADFYYSGNSNTIGLNFRLKESLMDKSYFNKIQEAAGSSADFILIERVIRKIHQDINFEKVLNMSDYNKTSADFTKVSVHHYKKIR